MDSAPTKLNQTPTDSYKKAKIDFPFANFMLWEEGGRFCVSFAQIWKIVTTFFRMILALKDMVPVIWFNENKCGHLLLPVFLLYGYSTNLKILIGQHLYFSFFLIFSRFLVSRMRLACKFAESAQLSGTELTLESEFETYNNWDFSYFWEYWGIWWNLLKFQTVVISLTLSATFPLDSICKEVKIIFNTFHISPWLYISNTGQNCHAISSNFSVWWLICMLISFNVICASLNANFVLV